MDASRAFMRTATLYSATKLGVADALAAGPMPVAELASTVGAKPDYLRRVLRFLAVIGVFEEPSPGVFANNAASELLQRGKPGGMSDMVLHMGDESYWAFTKLPDSMEASHPGVAFKDASGGLDYWAWLSQPENHAAAARFDRAMDAYSQQAKPAILQDYDWSQHANAVVADIGGGVGGVLSALLEQHPGMRGILFDRPPVMEEARSVWRTAHPQLVDRAQLVGGSFFESVPAADVYFMKHILHDWNDEDSVKILKVLRQAARPDSHLLLCEFVTPELDQPAVVHMAQIDLQMMVMCGSKERCRSEWSELLEAGGFRLDAVHPLSNGMCIVAARPI